MMHLSFVLVFDKSLETTGNNEDSNRGVSKERTAVARVSGIIDRRSGDQTILNVTYLLNALIF